MNDDQNKQSLFRTHVVPPNTIIRPASAIAADRQADKVRMQYMSQLAEKMKVAAARREDQRHQRALRRREGL